MVEPVTTIEEIIEFLRDDMPGSALTYHIGHLAFDRLKYQTIPTGGVKEVAIEPFDSIGRMLWEAYEAGLVHLYQMRIGPYNFAYMAEKRG